MQKDIFHAIFPSHSSHLFLFAKIDFVALLPHSSSPSPLSFAMLTHSRLLHNFSHMDIGITGFSTHTQTIGNSFLLHIRFFFQHRDFDCKPFQWKLDFLFSSLRIRCYCCPHARKCERDESKRGSSRA